MLEGGTQILSGEFDAPELGKSAAADMTIGAITGGNAGFARQLISANAANSTAGRIGFTATASALESAPANGALQAGLAAVEGSDPVQAGGEGAIKGITEPYLDAAKSFLNAVFGQEKNED